MSKSLYSVPNVVEAVYDETIKCVIVTWKNMGPHNHMRPTINAQNEALKKEGGKVVIVDTSTAKGVPSQVDQQWFGTEVFPLMSKMSVKAIITVVPQSAISKLAANQWMKSGSMLGIDMIDAASLEAAKEIAKEYN